MASRLFSFSHQLAFCFSLPVLISCIAVVLLPWKALLLLPLLYGFFLLLSRNALFPSVCDIRWYLLVTRRGIVTKSPTHDILQALSQRIPVCLCFRPCSAAAFVWQLHLACVFFNWAVDHERQWIAAELSLYCLLFHLRRATPVRSNIQETITCPYHKEHHLIERYHGSII